MSDSSADEPVLPDRFKNLQKLVGAWALPTEHARRERRATATMTDLQHYHELVGPEIIDIARHLDDFPMAQSLPPPELRLLHLAQMYMEVAWAVEVLNAPEEPDQVPRERWKITPLKRQIFGAGQAASPDKTPRSL